MNVLVTGATGFVGGHVARAAATRGDAVRVSFRDEYRLGRLGSFEFDAVRTDVLDRGALRRALRGVDLVFHCAGYVASSPARQVWRMNALSPRVVVEAAAAEDVERVVLTSSVAAIGTAPHGAVADESNVYRGGRGLIYGDAKHEGELEALGAAARLGVELVIVNPAYVLGVPIDRSRAGETSTRTVGNYLLGRLPAIVDGATNIVDAEDVATGHLLAADRGKPGERYILGGENLTWVDLIDRIATTSGERHPLFVLPREVAALARVQEELRVPGLIAPEALILMAQNWSYSSKKARRELGFRTRPLGATLTATIDWYRELIAAGAFRSIRPSALSLSSVWMRGADRIGIASGLRFAERRLGRRLIAGA